MYVQCLSVWSLLTFPLKTELTMNTHTIVTDIHQNILKAHGATDGQNLVVRDARSPCIPGKL